MFLGGGVYGVYGVSTGIFVLSKSLTPLFYFFYGEYRRVCRYVDTVDTP